MYWPLYRFKNEALREGQYLVQISACKHLFDDACGAHLRSLHCPCIGSYSNNAALMAEQACECEW